MGNITSSGCRQRTGRRQPLKRAATPRLLRVYDTNKWASKICFKSRSEITRRIESVAHVKFRNSDGWYQEGNRRRIKITHRGGASHMERPTVIVKIHLGL